MSATVTARERLEAQLSDPVRPAEIAELLDVSIGTVYESMRRFDAAKLAGDEAAMSRHVPCLHFGGALQEDSTFKGGRYTVPRSAFIEFYLSVGVGGAALERLYGEEVAS